MSYIKNFLLVLSVTLFSLTSKGQDLLIPREVVEWCVECDTKLQILSQIVKEKDSISSDKDKIITLKETQISSYKRDSISFSLTVSSYDSINALKDEEISIHKEENKKLRKGKWSERAIFGGIILTMFFLYKG